MVQRSLSFLGSLSIPEAPSTQEMLEDASPSTIRTPKQWCEDKAAQRVIERQRRAAMGAAAGVSALPSTIRCRICEMYIGAAYEKNRVYFYPVWDTNIVLGNQLCRVEHTILLICGECASRLPDEDEREFLQLWRGNPDLRIKRKALPKEYAIILAVDWSDALAGISQAGIVKMLNLAHSLLKWQIFMPRFLLAYITHFLLLCTQKQQTPSPRKTSSHSTSLPFMGMSPVASISTTNPSTNETIQSVSLLTQRLWQDQQRFISH